MDFKFGGLNSLGVHTDNGQTYETGQTNSLCVLCSTIYTPSVGVIYSFMPWITGKKLGKQTRIAHLKYRLGNSDKIVLQKPKL